MPRKIILKNYLSAGDVLVMEAAIASLHRSYPEAFITGVDTSCNEIYENHPLVKHLEPGEAEVISTNYDRGINLADKIPLHFMEGYCMGLGEQLGINLPCLVKAPRVYISDQEREWINQVEQTFNYKGKFWLLGAGSWKGDYTVKKYYKEGLQQVIDYYRGRIQFVQVGAVGNHHYHYDLEGVLDLRGRTDLRQLIRLASHASGALCLESFLNHLMASLGKPAVVLASGFLPPYWVSYPTSTILSSQGCLPCFRERPCWKARVVPMGDGDSKDKELCGLPVLGPDPVSKCMRMIEPEEIVRAIDRYYLGGVLAY